MFASRELFGGCGWLSTFGEKLAAVDKYAKLKDTIGAEQTSAESAEDIVGRIFKVGSTENLNVQINVGSKNE